MNSIANHRDLSILPPLFDQLKATASHLDFLSQPFNDDLSETGKILEHFNLKTPSELKAALTEQGEARGIKSDGK